jgi:hypothetical protein
VLSPTLLNPKALGEGAYPGPEIESWGLEKEQLALSGGLRSLLQTQVDDTATSERLQRVFALWGDPSRAEVTANRDGGRRLANVPEGVFNAFALPWIGGDGQAKPAAPRTSREFADVPSDEPPRDGGTEPETVARPARPMAPDRGTRGPTETQLAKLRDQVALARDQATIREPAVWHTVLHQIMGSLDWRKLGIDRWTWSRLFTLDLTKIKGTGRTGAMHFVLPCDALLYDGLEAYAELKIGDLSDELADFHRRKLALFRRRLESLAREHAERRLGLKPGETWNAAEPLAQILIARSWLRRSAAPTEALYSQWRDLLSDEREAISDPNSRTDAWREFLTATNAWHDRYRQILRDMVSLPQGAAPNFGIADAGMIASGLASFRDGRFSFASMSSDIAEKTGIGEIDSARDLTTKFASKLREIPRRELELLQVRARELSAALCGASLRSRSDRLDAIVKAFSQQLPGQALQPQRAWQEARGANATLLDDPAAVELVQSWILDLTGEGAPPPEALYALLDWLARAPASQLKSARDLFVLQGAKLTADLLPIIRERVSAGQGAVDLSGIHNAGATLRAAATKAETVLKGASK